jgi:HEAT repeat protein
MLLISIETTPNPNSMKLNFDESVEKPITYTVEQIDECEGYVRSILSVDGVKSIFVCANFITLNRDPRVDWKPILGAVTVALSKDSHSEQLEKEQLNKEQLNKEQLNKEQLNKEQLNKEQLNKEQLDRETRNEQRAAGAKAGQAVIVVQTFKGVPIQVKVSDTAGEQRIALEARFSDTAQAIQAATGADYLKERYWADWGARYGTAADVASEVVEEINARMDSNALQRLLKAATGDVECARDLSEVESDLRSHDWAERLKAVQELSEMKGTTSLLASVLADEHHQVRRLAAAALGASGDASAVAPLARVFLKDVAPGVRRTAGDALSDIGSAEAEPFACTALSDANKLVRWRAARLLADLGTEYALPYLRDALGDPQFEVNLEIESAIERISGGKEASLPMWKKIQEST